MNGDDFAQAPFPYFGAKSRIAAAVWERLGDPPNTVDPFMGTNALLLARPQWDWERGDWRDDTTRTETVNDADGFVCNSFRSLQHDPEATAHWADWPVNEADLTARHLWLVGKRESLTERLMADPDFYDAKIAGWWLWGICCWIGSGWCSGKGLWTAVDGQLVHLGNAGQGVNRQRPHLGNAGRGVNRQRVYLGNAGQGVNRQLPHLGRGQGVNNGTGRGGILDWFAALSARLRRVRVCCGDWRRVLGPTPTTKLGLTAVLLDPPYSGAERDGNLYAVDSGTVSADVREWALAHADDPLMRQVLFGYSGEHEMPPGWTALPWKTAGGYGSQGNGRGRENADREVAWFSKSCLTPAVLQGGLL